MVNPAPCPISELLVLGKGRWVGKGGEKSTQLSPPPPPIAVSPTFRCCFSPFLSLEIWVPGLTHSLRRGKSRWGATAAAKEEKKKATSSTSILCSTKGHGKSDRKWTAAIAALRLYSTYVGAWLARENFLPPPRGEGDEGGGGGGGGRVCLDR